MFSRYTIPCPAFLTGLLFLLLPFDSSAQTPANDECSTATVLTQNTICTDYSGNTIGATVSPVLSATCEENNTGDVWFRFTATDDSAVVSVQNISPTNTNAVYYFFGITAYSGTCGSLSEIGCNGGGHNMMNSSIMVGNMPLEILLTGLTIGQTVTLKLWKGVALDNSLNVVPNDLNFNICVQKVPPLPGCTALISPANAVSMTIYPVVPTTFKWNTATGASNYLLYLDTIITTPSEYNTIVVYDTMAIINNAFKFNTTYYWYVIPVNAAGVANGCSPEIRSFTTQGAPALPTNDVCTGAIPLVSGLTGLNQAATDDNASLPLCGSATVGAFKGLWYSFTPTTSGNLTIGICDAQFDSYIRIYSGTCNALACVAFNDDGCPTSTTGASSVTFPAIGNQSYYALVGSWDGDGLYGTYTLTTTGVPLGVHMSALTGELTANGYARLSWETYCEGNNSGFEIEHSINGITFERVGFIASKAGKGQSNGTLEYSYTDNSNIVGHAFYRITQIGFDGTKTVSNIVRLQAKQNEFNVTVAPNPAKDAIWVKTSGATVLPASIHVFDLTGRLLRIVDVEEPETLIDIKEMPQGFYLIQYTDPAHTRIFKISKQ